MSVVVSRIPAMAIICVFGANVIDHVSILFKYSPPTAVADRHANESWWNGTKFDYSDEFHWRFGCSRGSYYEHQTLRYPAALKDLRAPLPYSSYVLQILNVTFIAPMFYFSFRQRNSVTQLAMTFSVFVRTAQCVTMQ